MADACRLTTMDNPYDPFTDYTSWDQYDKEKGYHTAEYLARFVNLSDDMSQVEEDNEIERAIDEIIKKNPLHFYIKVKRTL